MRTRTKTLIIIATVTVGALLLVGGGVYAYDSSRKDTIADGITVAGVPVGGLTEDEARRKVGAEVAAGLERPVAVTHGKQKFNLSATDAHVNVDVGGMVATAVAASRSGNFVSRAVRDLTGGKEKTAVPADVTYSNIAIARLVARVSKQVDRPARDASVDFPSLDPVKEQDGLQLDDESLKDNLRSALTSPSDRTVVAPVHRTKPKVTTADVAKKYPTLLIVDRSNFRLKLYKDLKLKKSYPIAVGQVGLETPAGLYNIQNKGENVPWNVPNSAWAGDLAGTTIPGGSPENPIKARWLGIFDGAGIHGTDQLGSLGTAASHGCVRMSIPDVIELYPQVPVGAPVYIL
jgi:lipoprotein-anchoring transpeptidase ErfK/SrfK